MVVYDNDNNTSILYPNHSLTIDQMFIDYNNDKNALVKSSIYRTLRKTRMTVSRFRKWKKNKEIVLFARKSASGKWLYYNIQDKKEFEEVELRLAKVTLGITKKIERIQKILEMSPEERKRKKEEFSKYLTEKYARKRDRKDKNKK
jgi:hypothetical protein